MSRETLEKQALEAVCTCYYYELANTVDSASDEDLRAIIEIPFYSHAMAQIQSHESAEDYAEEIAECYKLNYKKGSKQ